MSTLSIPTPTISTGPKHMTETEAAEHYLREVAGRTKKLMAGSGVTALVDRLLGDVIDALATLNAATAAADTPTPEREQLSPETRAALDRGLAQSAAGEVVDLGSFAEYADIPNPAFECRACDYVSDEAGDTHTHPTPERVTLTAEEPSGDGWYAYDGGRQTMIFRLTRGQWYVTTDSGQCDPCEWGYIEQALSVWNLVPLDLAAREQALREEIAGEIEATTTVGMVTGYSDALDIAARIARNGTTR